MKTYTLHNIMQWYGVSQIKALRIMGRIRDTAYADGKKITRVIRDGVCVEMRIK